MGPLLTPLSKTSRVTFGDQLCERISKFISAGILSPGQKLPSCRKMALQLGISRNTVIGAYQTLITDRIVESRERSGYFVHAEATAHCKAPQQTKQPNDKPNKVFDILKPNILLKQFATITRPRNWDEYPYPFVCNQMDSKRFPLSSWRKCSADILSQNKAISVMSDYAYEDCDELIYEIQTRLLPNRGIIAEKDQILLTSGAQQAIFLTSKIFGGPKRKIAIEDPCYPDARNIFSLYFDDITPIKLDEEGIICNQNLAKNDLVYVTPNHQYPTSIRMTPRRRTALLDLAKKENIVIVEDDYDSKTDFSPQKSMSLKSSDTNNNVIYIGSLSKSLNPGLRLGYLVASADFVNEAKKLKGMMVRHLPPFLQLTTAKFISRGHFDSHLTKLQNIYRKRWNEADVALHKYFPECKITSGDGGTNFLIESPHKIDFTNMGEMALEQGIVIDELKLCYANPKDCHGLFRMGVSAVKLEKIEPGINVLRKVYTQYIEANRA